MDDDLDVRRRATPNSSWASITSRPLFISVLESIVIFGPIDHVGWASASSTPTSASSAAVRPAERPAAGREQDAGDLAPGVGRRPQALVHGAVLAVDRHQLGARRRAQRLHHRPGGDQALLVGQGQALAGAQRGHRDREPGEADDGVDDDVGAVDEVGEVVDDRRRTAARRPPRPAGPGRRRRRAAAGTRAACAISASTAEPTPRATTS